LRELNQSRQADLGRQHPPDGVVECLARLQGDRCIYDGVVELRNNSRIHKARWGLRPIAVKECFGTGSLRPDPAAAEREFAALTSIAQSASQSGVPTLTPQPLMLCLEFAVYAMAWVPGRPATEVILARATTTSHACAIGAGAGNWLRHIHALKALSKRAGDFESKVGHVEHLAASDRGADKLLRRSANSLVSHASEASAQYMPASWIHGDMKSDNLLVDGDQIVGLDAQLRDENTVVYDLAPFLNHLRLLKWTPRGAWHGQRLDLVADAFLNAYSQECAGWKLPIAWLRSYLLIQLIDPSRRITSLASLALRWAVRLELARAIDELERAGKSRSNGQ